MRRYYGVRLLDVLAGEMSPREAMVLVDHLPVDSAFAEASAQDDELAELLAAERDDEDEDAPARAPRITEFGPTNQLLTAVYDRLGEVIAAIVASAGGKPPPVRPSPRPETAADRLAKKVAEASQDYLLEQIEEARRREG